MTKNVGAAADAAELPSDVEIARFLERVFEHASVGAPRHGRQFKPGDCPGCAAMIRVLRELLRGASGALPRESAQ